MKAKKIAAVMISFLVCCLVFGIPAYSYDTNFDVHNTHYYGTYYQLGTFPSWITVRTGGCDVHIVYDELENKYINGVSGSGYITNENFSVSYSAYNIVDSNGNRLQTVYDSTYIQGTVSQTSQYIDINIHGVIYEKSY
jgi:hypothetical protein